MNIPRPKVIYDSIGGVVDIPSVQPMVDAPQFQLLRHKRQLSLTDLVFPMACHTRFEHSIGSFSATRRLADRWLRLGLVTRDMRQALMGYALYHDIGHGPFSHMTEDFGGDHKVRTQEIAYDLKETIEKCGIDHALMMRLLAHQHPLHAAVSDKNIGIEKLDYLERDGVKTGMGKPEGIEYLRKHMYFIDDTIAVDEKMVDYVTDTLDFYMKMYKHVYLRKCLIIAQRAFHKMLFYLVDNGEIRRRELPDMTDSELIGRVALAKHPGARKLYQRLFRERNLFKEAVVIRSEAQMCETRVLTKDIRVIGIPEVRMQKLMRATMLQKSNHIGLELLESSIARLLKLPDEDVVVVPVFYADRFKTTDVMIYGSDGKLHSLRERRPHDFESMAELAKSYVAVRVCVSQEHRAQLARMAEQVASMVEAA